MTRVTTTETLTLVDIDPKTHVIAMLNGDEVSVLTRRGFHTDSYYFQVFGVLDFERGNGYDGVGHGLDWRALIEAVVSDTNGREIHAFKKTSNFLRWAASVTKS